jgi:N-acyl-phosphatidylethanolamine-hydrolysing phospholipase D
MHWGTFQLTDEPMDEPIQLLSKLTQKLYNPNQFTAMMHGQTIKI